ncbi:MAG: hypothetical protein C0410_06365 [Anaerolinea sp.]|nr:hypothetical protein [Anaerolinea sp.]
MVPLDNIQEGYMNSSSLKFFIRFLMMLLIVILTSCEKPTALTTTPNATQKPADIISLGYYTGSQESYDSLITFPSYLDIVSVDVYGLDFDGNVVGSDGFNVAAKNPIDGIQYFACISNWNSDPAVNNFDPALAQTAIVKYKEKVISQLVVLAQSEGYSGINIDFESIAYPNKLDETRTDFSTFIHELASRLHEKDKKLIISVPGKTLDDKQNDWSYPFDLATLGRDADYLQLMTYDQHGSWGGPGSVSGADWLQEVITYTTSIVDPSKLLIGLPAYGYDWDLSEYDAEKGTYSTTSFSWKDVPTLLAKPGAETFWDDTSQSPSVTYSLNGHNHVAWFENTDSIQIKMRIVPEYKLGGLSVWALGMETIDFWQAAESVGN